MIKTFFNALPGPVAVRALIMVLLVIVALIALQFIYTWMGDTFLDTGGSVQ